MNITEMIEYFEEHKPRGRELVKKKHKKFKDSLLKNLSYIGEMQGEKRIGIYIRALLEGYHDAPPKCECCDNHVTGVRKDGFNTYCSKECMNKGTAPKRIETCERLYGGIGNGSEYIKEKVERTNLEKYGKKTFMETEEFRDSHWVMEKYGVSHISQSKEVQKKKKEKRLSKMSESERNSYERSLLSVEERWGASHPMKSEDGKMRLKESLLKKYGVDNPMQIPESLENIKKTNLEKYGKEYYTQTPEYAAVMKSHNSKIDKFLKPHFKRTDNQLSVIKDKEKLEFLYKKYKTILNMSDALNINPTSLGRILKHHGIEIEQHHRRSGIEYAIIDYIKELGDFSIKENDRTFGYEIDIYVPSKNVAIEVNGVHWHSEIFKNKTYHADKTGRMISDGLTHLHVWEHHWNCDKKRNIIKNRIKHMLGMTDDIIYARRTKIIKPKTSKIMDFYERTHIQGKKGATEHIALAYDGEIVAALSLTDKGNGVWYLERYSTKGQVVGGFSKLFKHFLKETDGVIEIQTHASLDYSKGQLYISNGFTRIWNTPPNYTYHKCGKYLSRNQAMKHKLPKLLENYDESMTEVENMNNHGFFRVYDSGSIKFAYYVI